jgi:inhibitor of cysteine peptidase
MKIIGIILTILILAGCTSQIGPGDITVHDDPDVTLTDDVSSFDDTDEGIKKFSNVNEIRTFLDEQAVEMQGMGYSGGFGRMGGVMMEAAMDSMAVPMAAIQFKDGGATDFSETNVQVKGVDEADFVKNDGKYIYTIAGGKLVIVNAFPAENAKIVYEDEIEGNPRNLFVNGDKLIVFVTDSDDIEIYSEFDFMPRNRYVSVTKVLVYDITNKAKPKVVQEYSVNGDYYEARMIDDYIYFVAKDDLYYSHGYVDLPVIMENNVKVLSPEIYYFDNPETNYVFHTVASFNINGQDLNAKTYMMGYSNTMMVSKDNIYITYQKNLPYTYYKGHNQERFYQVVVPLLPADVQVKVKQVERNDGLNSYEKWDEITILLEDMYNGMDEDVKIDLIEEIEDAVEIYEAKLEAERRKTIIHKIGIDEGDIDYKARGEVEGYLLNQFSMDEFQSNLRVATTTFIYRVDSTMYNNVYVLDEDLEIIGEIEDIAPDEKIYSARFIGERLYMVTFKNIDPFFVIDLSNPEDPNILGELKIPGFSDYLHPYDENHIIGIGKETEGNEWGGVSTKGVKIALFDVSDVENPKQVAKIEIGDSGTDSEALNEHKAFLFDKENNLLVLPIREVKERVYDEYRGYYKWDVWQGAYVFDITKDDISVRGKVAHEEGEDDYYWNSPWAVRRSLYMDDVLYTISSQRIKMNDLDTIDEINEIELPYEDYRHIYY